MGIDVRSRPVVTGAPGSVDGRHLLLGGRSRFARFTARARSAGAAVAKYGLRDFGRRVELFLWPRKRRRYVKRRRSEK